MTSYHPRSVSNRVNQALRSWPNGVVFSDRTSPRRAYWLKESARAYPTRSQMETATG